MNINKPHIIRAGIGTTANAPLFTVEAGAEYEVTEVIATWATASTSLTLDLKKASSGTSGSSGTSVLAATFDTSLTAATPVTKSRTSGLATVQATRILSAGQSLWAVIAGTAGSVAGLVVTIMLVPTRKSTFRGH